MAINPMQRRSRNMFLLGFLLALIIGGLIAFLFYNQMVQAKNAYEALNKLQISVYVAPDDLKSGDEIILDELLSEYDEEDENNEKNANINENMKVLTKSDVITTLSTDELIDSSLFKYTYVENKASSEEENEEEYTRVSKKLVMKIDVPAGTVITKDMIEEVDEPISDDQRLQEYNMLVLPTSLEADNYIDVRLSLPTGEDYIVVSKKKVYDANADTVWLKMREDEILTIGSAIVEAYIIPGSKLYATVYTEPGRQQASKITYAVSDSVLNLISKDQNIVTKAIDELNSRYNNDYDYRDGNRSYRDPVNSLINENAENKNELVQTGVQEEITKLKTSRQQYVEELQGGSAGLTE